MPRTFCNGIYRNSWARALEFVTSRKCLWQSLDFLQRLGYSLVDGSLGFPDAAVAASGATVAPCKADVLALFQKLLPLELFWAALKQAKVRENNRVYHSAVVVWLMIWQRLQAQGTRGR